MNVYIPLAIGQIIPDEVYSGIKNQSVFCDIVEVATEGVVDSQRNYSSDRWRGECRSRNEIISLMGDDKDDVAVWMDRDLALTDTGTFHSMLHYLQEHPNCGAVGVHYKNEASHNHVACCCLMIKIKPLLDIIFRGKQGCCCNEVRNHLTVKGYTIEYLDKQTHGEEIL